MKHDVEAAEKREVDESLTFTDLQGDDHPTVINHESDQAYYILEGSGTVKVDGEEFDVSESDLVSIPSDTTHTIGGDLRYLIITSLPFDPENEDVVDQ